MLMMELPCRRYIDGRLVELDTDFNPWTDYPDDGTDPAVRPPPQPKPPKLAAPKPPKPVKAPKPPRTYKTRYDMDALVVGEARDFYPAPGESVRTLQKRICSCAYLWKRDKGIHFVVNSLEHRFVRVTRVL